MGFGDLANQLVDLVTGGGDSKEPACPHCGKKASEPVEEKDDFQKAGETLSNGVQGPSGQEFMKHNPFNKK